MEQAQRPHWLDGAGAWRVLTQRLERAEWLPAEGDHRLDLLLSEAQLAQVGPPLRGAAAREVHAADGEQLARAQLHADALWQVLVRGAAARHAQGGA